MSDIKKIGVFTSGGDAPGMNACLRAVVRKAISHDLEVVGILRGYQGMIEADFVELDSESVSNIIQKGGTVLKSARSVDFRTPEGRYLLDLRNPNSDYFLSIHVSYPSADDRREAQQSGVDPGGAIMIHGQPNEPKRSETYYKTQDWTNGCIAVSNSDMIDIWLMTGDNVPIEIRP